MAKSFWAQKFFNGVLAERKSFLLSSPGITKFLDDALSLMWPPYITVYFFVTFDKIKLGNDGKICFNFTSM